jgi:orotate phosphoribosyltransferase
MAIILQALSDPPLGFVAIPIQHIDQAGDPADERVLVTGQRAIGICHLPEHLDDADAFLLGEIVDHHLREMEKISCPDCACFRDLDEMGDLAGLQAEAPRQGGLGELMFDKIKGLEFDFVGGLEIGAIPVVSSVCMKSWPELPIYGFFVRDAAKDHGTKKLIDGHIREGATVIIVDDVTTKGNSAMKAVTAVRNLGCKVLRAISIVDRQEGATKRFAAEGIQFESIFTTKDFD